MSSSSQKIPKTHIPDPHFGQSFVLSIVAIIMLTMVLPLLTPASKTPDNNSGDTNPARVIVK